MIDLVTSSRRRFFFFVGICNKNYRSGHDLAFYRELIDIHKKYCDLEDLIRNDTICQKIYDTLIEWDMNKRGAKLASFDDFKKSLRFWKDDLVKLYKFKLYKDLESEITRINGILYNVFCNLKVMKSNRKIVGVSKALHLLFPDLIMPIDSTYTMQAFYGYNKYETSCKKEFNTFREIFERTFEITTNLELKKSDVDGKQWNTSVPKLIDNAIIGFFNSLRLKDNTWRTL